MRILRPVITGLLLSLFFFSSASALSPFDACNPHAQSPTAQLGELAPVIQSFPEPAPAQPVVMAVPVQEDARDLTWSDMKIDLNELKRLGALPEKEILKAMRDDYQLQVGVSHTSSDQMDQIKRSLRAPSAASSIPKETLDPAKAKRNAAFDEFENQDPITIRFTQAFANQDGYGVFIRKGSDPLKAGVNAAQHTIIFKDFATKTIILHEFAHFMIHRERERRGLPDPWAGPSAEEEKAVAEFESFKDRPSSDQDYQRALFTASRLRFQRQLQTTGEELDVHRLTVEFRNELQIANDTRGQANALVVFQQNLEELKSSTAKMRAQLEGFRNQGIKALQEASDLEKLIQSSEQKIVASERWFQGASNELGYRFSPLNASASASAAR